MPRQNIQARSKNLHYEEVIIKQNVENIFFIWVFNLFSEQVRPRLLSVMQWLAALQERCQSMYIVQPAPPGYAASPLGQRTRHGINKQTILCRKDFICCSTSEHLKNATASKCFSILKIARIFGRLCQSCFYFGSVLLYYTNLKDVYVYQNLKLMSTSSRT